MESPDSSTLALRFVSVMETAHALRSEVARNVSKSGERMLVSQRLCLETRQVVERSAASRGSRRASPPQPHRIADQIAKALSNFCYAAFVASEQQDTASLQ